MIPDDPAEAEVSITTQLLRLERAGERTAIEMGPYSAFMLVALCQNMARRFSSDDVQGDVFVMIGRKFDAYFEGTAAGDFIAAEWKETSKVREVKKSRKDDGK